MGVPVWPGCSVLLPSGVELPSHMCVTKVAARTDYDDIHTHEVEGQPVLPRSVIRLVEGRSDSQSPSFDFIPTAMRTEDKRAVESDFEWIPYDILEVGNSRAFSRFPLFSPLSPLSPFSSCALPFSFVFVHYSHCGVNPCSRDRAPPPTPCLVWTG